MIITREAKWSEDNRENRRTIEEINRIKIKINPNKLERE